MQSIIVLCRAPNENPGSEYPNWKISDDRVIITGLMVAYGTIQGYTVTKTARMLTAAFVVSGCRVDTLMKYPIAARLAAACLTALSMGARHPGQSSRE